MMLNAPENARVTVSEEDTRTCRISHQGNIYHMNEQKIHQNSDHGMLIKDVWCQLKFTIKTSR